MRGTSICLRMHLHILSSNVGLDAYSRPLEFGSESGDPWCLGFANADAVCRRQDWRVCISIGTQITTGLGQNLKMHRMRNLCTTRCEVLETDGVVQLLMGKNFEVVVSWRRDQAPGTNGSVANFEGKLRGRPAST